MVRNAVEHLEDLEADPVVAGAELAGEAGKSADAAGGTNQPADAKGTAKADRNEAGALQARIRELEEENRFWAGKAKGSADKPEPKPAEGPDELEQLLADAGVDEDTAASLLDDIGEKGVDALRKRGVVTKAELKQILGAAMAKMEAKAAAIADTRVDGAKSQMTAEAKLLKDFPDLADETSDFAKATAREFATMVAEDPSLKNSYGALRAAARMVAQQRVPDASSKGSLANRMQRIASQAPSRGGRPSNEFDDDDVDITPEARTILAHAAKYGVDEAAYRRHARRSN